MAKMTIKNCKCCSAIFEVRLSDISRGKGLYCSRSCKSKDMPRNNLPQSPTGQDHRLWKGGSLRRKAWRREYSRKFPERVRARRKVYEARRKGLLVKEACSVCGDARSEAHHEDYNKPLEIIWLCRKHHRAADKKLGIGSKDFAV